jgi:serine/threonine-protein kinase
MADAETTTGVKKRRACSTCGDEFDTDSDKCPFDGTKLTVIAQKLAPGVELGGRFEVLSPIGDGGMGSVYKCTHKLMKRTVAIKTIHPSLVANGAALKRFQQEAQALSALKHTNILEVYDFFISDDGQPYLVMDYLEGTDLDNFRTQCGPMPWNRAARIFLQVCAGLGHAHQNGIIHRDIKPSNIMLVEEEGQPDVVKIVDFGIAKVREPDEKGGLTATGDVFGSPEYMSPEQCRAQKLDQRSDVYSLGCVMYSTLTGKKPFSSSDSMECMYKQVNELPPAFDPKLDVQPAFEAVVFKAMAKKPEERFQSMAEMSRSITQATGERIGSSPIAAFLKASSKFVAVASGGLVSVAAPPTLAKATAPAEAPSAASASNHLKLYGALAAGAVVIVLTVACLVMSSMKPAAQPGVQSGTIAPAASSASSSTTGASAVQSNTPPMETSSPVSAPPQSVPQSTSASPPDKAPAATPLTAQQIYSANMESGKRAFAVCDWHNAQLCFNAAHHAAHQFGNYDDRFLDALEWQGKVAAKLGDMNLARQAANYVSAIRKRLHKK